MLLELQINIFMSLLLVVTIVHAYFKLNRSSNIFNLFISTKIIILVMLILEILRVMYNKIDYLDSIVIQKVINIIEFSLAPFPIFLIWILFNKWIYKKIDRKIICLLSAPLLVNLIICSLNYRLDYIFNYIFKITIGNTYLRGPMFLISPLVNCFYFLLTLIFLWVNRMKVNKEELTTFKLVVLVPFILGAIQFKYNIYLTIWSSWGISIIIMYTFILNDNSKKDSLTGLENRLEYYIYIDKLKKKNNLKLTAINIDLDGIKYINDNYGHYEGDQSIKVFASLLKDVFGTHIKTIRLRSDEFIILIKDDNEFLIKKFIKDLINKLEEYNKNSGKEYKIKFSYGIAIYNPNRENIEELLNRSDEAMYRNKNSKSYYNDKI